MSASSDSTAVPSATEAAFAKEKEESTLCIEASSSDGETDESEDRSYVPGQFEGPEKTLEILFKPGLGSPRGCRELSREQLDAICASAKCTIMSRKSNDHLDAYVLSESSLFVYSHKMILKTCGKTTLLRCLHHVLRMTAQLGLELEWLGYSRKNYTFPDDQIFPHSNFEQEFQYLKKHPHLEQTLDGSGYVLGPITGDHWLVYVSDKCDRPSSMSTDRTLNVMMFDMDPTVAANFYMERNATGEKMTEASGIGDLVPGALVDDRAFEPCGYSMNAILYGSYTTVHITPEPECSYASFETNTPLKSYTSLINNILATFKPNRVVITMMADAEGLREITESPFDNPTFIIPGYGIYNQSTTSSTRVEGDTCVTMGNWELDQTTDADRLNREHRKSNRLTSF